MSNTDLPEKENIPEDDAAQEAQKLDRRTAIAQARAIRREAAALENDDAKAQANETVSMMMEAVSMKVPRIRNSTSTMP